MTRTWILGTPFLRTRAAVEPKPIATYFGEGAIRPRAVPVEAFYPGHGWRRATSTEDHGMVTVELARWFRRQGATALSVRVGTRQADFAIAELIPS